MPPKEMTIEKLKVFYEGECIAEGKNVKLPEIPIDSLEIVTIVPSGFEKQTWVCEKIMKRLAHTKHVLSKISGYEFSYRRNRNQKRLKGRNVASLKGDVLLWITMLQPHS